MIITLVAVGIHGGLAGRRMGKTPPAQPGTADDLPQVNRLIRRNKAVHACLVATKRGRYPVTALRKRKERAYPTTILHNGDTPISVSTTRRARERQRVVRMHSSRIRILKFTPSLLFTRA